MNISYSETNIQKYTYSSLKLPAGWLSAVLSLVFQRKMKIFTWFLSWPWLMMKVTKMAAKRNYSFTMLDQLIGKHEKLYRWHFYLDILNLGIIIYGISFVGLEKHLMVLFRCQLLTTLIKLEIRVHWSSCHLLSSLQLHMSSKRTGELLSLLLCHNPSSRWASFNPHLPCQSSVDWELNTVLPSWGLCHR